MHQEITWETCLIKTISIDLSKIKEGFSESPTPSHLIKGFYQPTHKTKKTASFGRFSTNNFKMHFYLLISRCHQFSVICWSIWREICVILNCNCTREIQNTVPLARTGCFVETISVFFDLQSFFGIKLLFHFK